MYNIFISYYYDEAKGYKEELKKWLINNFNDIQVIDEKVDYKHKGLSNDAIIKIIRENYLRISNFVIILVSKNAWKRRHLDWELSAALSSTKSKDRKPIIAIFTPDYGQEYLPINNKTSTRLIKNIKNSYIQAIFWNELNKENFFKLLKKAEKRANKINPINNDYLRRKNKY